MNCIPILCYTHIRNMQDSYSVDVEMFERHIKYLQKKQYTFLHLDDILAFKKDPKSLPKRCVLLTFDGAWRDIYENAYPIMKHYWIKGGLFLVTEWLDEASKGSADYVPTPHSQCKNTILRNAREVVCNWEEVKKMQDIFSIGSMTHTYQFSNIVSLPWHEDLELSKKIIKEKLGIETKHLAWPDGSYNLGLLRTAKTIGYEVFYTMEQGINRIESDNDALKRCSVKNSLFWLKKAMFATSSARSFKIGKIFL
ncbi:chitin deacetylase [Helicobacter sp. MIT 05-5293]|uniref:Xylanase/chitin deacetylase n=1 Tax=uncultured Helicobacter sp. TaxID=175537 RepID=A0A650EL68_9HELI|nr:polysaccharide deacetylase family protein [Helicobacter sp. MIT 05-5293]QGT50479.1 xylanase/chitin deacetylase [uncultured Helicobacter sp.]TLD82104.1 chitin deacetylase [Helicobacter sp. MIT 05-5293]